MVTARRQLGLLWGGVALALVALAPLGERLASSLPACPVKSIAGFPCLTCGATRAALALGRLDPLAALTVNPLAAVAWSALVVLGVVAGVAALVDRPLALREPRPTLGLRLGLAAAALGNWAYLVLAGV